MMQYTTQMNMFLLLRKYKMFVYLQRQVLHDQLLQNLPGWEHSKSMRLSGAM